VQDATLLMFPDTGRFRGIAFVSFYSPNAASAALRMDGQFIEECQLKVLHSRNSL
jgi:RNA recognition motif-containing protein